MIHPGEFHERLGSRQWRPRTCFGLEDCSESACGAGVRRTRQCRYGVEAENVNIPAYDFPKLIRFAKDNRVELTVVGPEGPLCAGIVDAFEDARLRVFGPNKSAAQLEGSKVFCKKLLHGADVPSGDFHVFQDADRAICFIETRYPNAEEVVPVVVKADGLAAGKGAIVCSNRREAVEAIERIARQREFGGAGDQFLIEERLHGQEVSVLAITDGRTILTLPPAQDHKPAYDGDTGPNTGGMGAYSPAPLVTEDTQRWIEEHVLVPTVHALKRTRHPMRGVMYAGLMMTHQGPKVLEYNVRFGDPECQPILMRLQSDIVDILEATVSGKLEELTNVRWDPRPAVCVVMASEGYPAPTNAASPSGDSTKQPACPMLKSFTRARRDATARSSPMAAVSSA